MQAVAVCYLFSFRNGAHEERTAEILAEEEPNWRISLSSRVLPVIREYPRLSTTAIDAYVGPIMERYLVNLDQRLKARGVTTPQVFLMQSNGGLMRITMGARFPNQTLISGPAAGVVAGSALARTTARRNLVTLDIGGTSTDISVIADGRASETSSGRIAGQDVGTPMLAVHTLGAGGGTIAWIGRDGLMKVGPQSAGAVPGPACYGRGGSAPTVTDANLVLGALGGNSVLGGRMTLDRARAERAITEGVAKPLGLDLVTAAAGIIKIVNTNMAVDLRLAFQSRGEDPRRFALLAFGGAGPLHAAYLARDLGIPDVLVPPHPGLTSAMGLLQTDVRHLYLRSAVGLLSSYPVVEINRIFAELRRRALDDVEEEGLDLKALRFKQQLDLRYLHQGYHLTVEGPTASSPTRTSPRSRSAFDDLHRRTYGASAPEEDAELVTLRLLAEIPVPHLRLAPIAPGSGRPADARIGGGALRPRRGAFADAHVYDRTRLGAGDRLEAGHHRAIRLDQRGARRAGADRGRGWQPPDLGAKAMTLDPITTEVIISRIRETTAAMAHALFHSGYSPILRESQDGTAGLTDANGRVIMVGGGLQYHCCSIRARLPACERYPVAEMRDGDSFISNDPYKAGNSHVPDIVVITPIFHGGKIIAFGASVAHKADVGGLVPGPPAPPRARSSTTAC